ncbi:MAG: DUF917 domain-containing protein [Propionibacteriaceae bacterium]|jgi:DUF917 family protein|nr:DUF917 domain-containing protein [Propionibacteriaceae bacterium]
MGYPALSLDALADYECGCEVLGSGGGGTPTPITAALTELLKTSHLPLLQSLPADAQVCAIGAMGGPSVFAERLPSGREFQVAKELLTRLGQPAPTVIVPMETAGMNGPYAAYLALVEHLPLFDADLMGRALPTIQQSTLASSPNFGPAALVTPSGEALLVDSPSAESVERIMRAALPACGGWGLLVTRPFGLDELRGHVVTGTVSRALSLGQALRRLPVWARGPQIAQALSGRWLGSGAIEQVLRHPRQGAFGGGNVYLTDSASGRIVRVEYQNEYLLATIDGQVAVTCPDLLIVVDPRLRRLIRPEELRPRLEVAVVALEGPLWWKRSPDRLDRVSPRAFGLDQDPIPWAASIEAAPSQGGPGQVDG